MKPGKSDAHDFANFLKAKGYRIEGKIVLHGPRQVSGNMLDTLAREFLNNRAQDRKEKPDTRESVINRLIKAMFLQQKECQVSN